MVVQKIRKSGSICRGMPPPPLPSDRDIPGSRKNLEAKV